MHRADTDWAEKSGPPDRFLLRSVGFAQRDTQPAGSTTALSFFFDRPFLNCHHVEQMSNYSDRTAVAAIVLSLTAHVGANPSTWTVTNLHPSRAAESFAYRISNGQQVGWSTVGGAHHASVWTGSAASWVDLHPAGASLSEAYGVYDGMQVGRAVVGGVDRATLWSGSAPGVNLTPSGSPSSQAQGISAGTQVGYAAVNGWNHAGTWSGSSATWASLHPSPTLLSQAHGADGEQQVGVTVADASAPNHAALWSGSSSSWVDLHPADATWSWARAVDDGQQVGWIFLDGVGHASLWNGTAESWVDLTPEGATESWGQDVHAGRQAGYARFDGVYHAGIWSGSAESWEDISLALTGSWGNTYANGVWSDANTIYVVGSGFNVQSGRNEALLWSRPIAPPAPGDINGDGIVNAADLGVLLGAWGSNSTAADLDGDGVVGGSDLAILLGAWTG